MTWPTKTDFVDGDVLTAAQVNNIGTNLNLADPTAATVGQVLTADGAGSMSFQDAGGGGLTQIATTSLTSGSSYTFSSIPGTYKHLFLQVENVTCSGTATHYGITYNSSTSTNSGGFVYYNNGSAGTLGANGMTAYYGLGPVAIVNEPINTTNSLNNFFWQIWNYTGTANTWRGTTTWGNYFSNNSRVISASGIGTQTNTAAAITQIVLRIGNTTVASTATFTAGTATLYGVQ